jgi:dGTPase
MNWKELLSARRMGESATPDDSETRNRFEQDFDRIIFSHPFRKLQDKTQVFPMPEDDFVHTRLTHSLEVSSVGRSLGKECGKIIIERHPELSTTGITYHHMGAITAAASLAHDLGNPPFGHSGEQGISAYFKYNESGKKFKALVNKEEWMDLCDFEGNAQGFRILNGDFHGGLKLTFATLAAFTKYPRTASTDKDPKRKSHKKYGFTQSELALFKKVADDTGLLKIATNCWARHPLTFLVEAADDICYHIIDLEDGTRLGLVSFDETKELLAEIIGDRYAPEKLDKMDDLNEKLGILRALSISQLIKETMTTFLDLEEKILDGTFDQALTDVIPSAAILDKISKLSVNRIYRSTMVLEREAAGLEVIEKLMERLIGATYHVRFEPENLSPRLRAVFRLLPESYKSNIDKSDGPYEAFQLVMDFVSSLTDSSAIKLYRTVSGYPLN